MNIAINGFGRIGRAAFKIALEKGIKIVAINDLTELKTLANLLEHDSVYGTYDKKVNFDSGNLIVDGVKIPIFSEKDPKNLPWNKYEVDVVLECTGVFTSSEKSQSHIEAGAKKVVISAPAKDDITPTYLIGVNDDEYQDEKIISNASCTTNCVAPITKLIADNFGIKKAIMSTVHAYTAGQNLVDGPNKDPRRGRAAAENIVPTTTGAAIATIKILPSLKDKFDGMAIRVPVACGSLADCTYLLEKDVTKEQLNQAIKDATGKDEYKGVLTCTEEPVVSSDIISNPYSSIVDLNFTKVVDGNLVKIIAWYDNEMGYSYRLVEMAEKISL